MKKKGFTFIELLAAIVILAILALIVSLIISGVIKKSKISGEEEIGLYPGKTVYFNPVTGQKCNNYTEDNSASGVKEGCMLFYVIKDNGETIDLILDHNTSSGVEWAETGKNANGPLTALEQLKTDTAGWHTSLSRTDNYTVSQNIDGIATSYTVNYNGLKARMITAQEIADIAGATEKNGWDETTSNTWYYLDSLNHTKTVGSNYTKKISDYAWLFNNLNNGTNNSCIKYGCTIDKGKTSGDFGYWTATAFAGDFLSAWSVFYYGYVHNDYVYYTHRGIRPVITVSSNILDQ